MKFIATYCFAILVILLLGQTTWAQPSPPGPDPQLGSNFNPSMGVIIIVLVAALFFMGFFSIYIRHCNEDTSTHPVGRRIGSLRRSRRAPRGLDPEVIESFPTFDYAAVKSEKIGKGALECAVCLTEFEDDDMLRLLPKCDHVFHPDCIDAWLVGHTTCPVCRCNLKDDTSVVVGEVDPTQQAPTNDIVVEVGDFDDVNINDRMNNNNGNNNNRSNNNNYNENEDNESMEQPLHGRMTRNRTMRNLSFGRPRWLGKLARSFSTGHVAVKQWDNMERFTLRLPAEVRKQIISGKLERTTSLLVLPRESSTRRGYRTGFGEGSSRGRVGSTRWYDRNERSDRWVFSLAPPFFTRAPSVKSPRVMVMNTASTASRGGSLRGSVRDRDRENVTASRGGSLRGSVRDQDRVNVNQEGSLRGNVQNELTQLPI